MRRKLGTKIYVNFVILTKTEGRGGGAGVSYLTAELCEGVILLNSNPDHAVRATKS